MSSLPNTEDLVWLFAPNQMPPTDYFAIATITNLSPLRVAFEGNVDVNGNPVETPQAMMTWRNLDLIVGDRVIMIQVGDTWVVAGVIDGVGRQTSRYTWARTANGVATGIYDHFGTPSTTPWSTGSLTGGAQSMSRITITKTCHIDLWAQCNGQANLRFIFWSNGITPYEEHIPQTSQGGGVFQNAIHWSGVALAGEIFDMNIRNSFTGTLNFAMKTFCTFSDIVPLIVQT